MKKTIFLLGIVPLFVGLSAQAVHHAVYVSAIAKVSDSECAVELTISEANQDAFVDEDHIKIDADTLVTFEAVIDAGINGEEGNNDAGDTILAGSTSFDNRDDADVDLSFDDASCTLLDADAVVGFYIDGDTLIDSIDLSQAEDFGNNTGVSKINSDDDILLADFSTDSFVVTNNSGDIISLGIPSEPDCEGEDSGCGEDPEEPGGGSTQATGSCSLVAGLAW